MNAGTAFVLLALAVFVVCETFARVAGFVDDITQRWED